MYKFYKLNSDDSYHITEVNILNLFVASFLLSTLERKALILAASYFQQVKCIHLTQYEIL